MKRGRQAGRGSGPAKAMPAKRQRVLDPPQALARQAGRLAAHSRSHPCLHAFLTSLLLQRPLHVDVEH